MTREFVGLLLLLPVAGCSFLLDFSDKAIPLDAPIDAAFPEAECAYKEPNDSLLTAAMITPADTGPAAICAAADEDHDFYRFTVPANTLKVEVQIAFMNQRGDLDLRLRDKTGTTIALSSGVGDGEAITCPGSAPSCPALAADDYVFEVFPAIQGATNDYTIALTLTPM